MSQKDTFLLKETLVFEKVEEYIKFIDENSSVSLGDLIFRVLETPGHTPGGLSFYCEEEKVVFVGDLLFAEGFVGRTDFEYGEEITLQVSIREILRLPDNTHVYSGHGPSFLISDWRA